MAQWRLCDSSYRGAPSEASLHTQYYIHISSPSTVDNEGGDWLATGPIGYPSGFAFSDYVEADNRQQRAVNRGLVSDEFLFFLQGDRLFRTDYKTSDDISVDGFVGNSWSIVHTFTNMETGRTGRNTGIYPTMFKTTSSGSAERYVVGAYNSTVAGANTWKGFRYNVRTGVASETSSMDLEFAATPSQGGIKAEIFHDGKLYFIGTSAGGIGVYDPQSQSMSKISWPTTDVWGPHDFCVFGGKLYCLNRGTYGGGGGSGLYIWKIDGVISEAIDFSDSGYGATSFGSEQYEGRCVLFTDNNLLYAGILVSNAGGVAGTKFFSFTQNGDGTLSLYAIHPGATYGDDGGTWRVRLNSFIDQNTNPDGPPNLTLNIDQHGATGCYRHQWVWQGPTTSAIEEDSTQGLTLHELRETARSHQKNGGGERIFVPPYGGPRAEIRNFDYGSEAGRALIEYEVFNNVNDFPAGSPCTIQLRYSPSGHIPFHRGTLYSPSVGTLAENNTVIQLTSSASGTVYNFEWDYSAAGFNFNNRPNVALLISTTGVP